MQYATDQPPSKLMTPSTTGITIVPTMGFVTKGVDEGLVEVEDVEVGWLAVEVVFDIAL